jgi:hypothetical protein
VIKATQVRKVLRVPLVQLVRKVLRVILALMEKALIKSGWTKVILVPKRIF